MKIGPRQDTAILHFFWLIRRYDTTHNYITGLSLPCFFFSFHMSSKLFQSENSSLISIQCIDTVSIQSLPNAWPNKIVKLVWSFDHHHDVFGISPNGRIWTYAVYATYVLSPISTWMALTSRRWDRNNN